MVADQLRGSDVRAKGAGTPPCGRADSARSASHSGRHRAVPGRRSQGYINQVERSGKKVGNNKLVAAFPDDANVGQRPAAGRR